MNERPILFSGEMVRAILDGRKTQTRRVVKVLPWTQPPYYFCGDIRNSLGFPASDGETWAGFTYEKSRENDPCFVKCPYGKPGDRLWVRETWNAVHFVPEIVEGHVTKYSDHWFVSDEIPKNSNNDYWSLCYAADCDSFELEIVWRPSIFMPRWASRITLEVVNVRVERLQDISEEDATAEGVSVPLAGVSEWGGPGEAIYEYMRLWDSINAKRGHSWAANPWVWVIEFKNVSGEK